jgi:subfamily B ATP-binding cassette protein HlyB/CyaB
LSASLTPIFRRRLEDKFERGAENQAFLVETVTGVATLKSMAVEPQMQRRWEDQLAGYVHSSFRVLSLGNWGSRATPPVRRAGSGIRWIRNGCRRGSSAMRCATHCRWAPAAY